MGIKRFVKKIVFKLMSNCMDVEESHFQTLLLKFDENERTVEKQLAALASGVENIESKGELLKSECVGKIAQIEQSVNEIEQKTDNIIKDQMRFIAEMHKHIDYFHQDIFSFLAQTADCGNPLKTQRVQVITNHPVAIHSNDHLHPRGTANDNTRAPFFIRKCEELFPNKKIKYMDIGCAGGGIVLDALLRGHFAIGLEGSDYSLLHQRAEWRALRHNLFTCDVTFPFDVQTIEGKEHVNFDVISAWEVLEHIPEDSLDQMIKNIIDHLEIGGVFIGTAAQFGDYDPVSGASMHVTIKPREWWEDKFTQYGLVSRRELFNEADMARAWGNPPLPYLIEWKDEQSPYIVMRKE